MWRQSKLLDLKLWQTACQGAKHSCESLMNLQGARYGHSAGKQKILRLERELSKLRATSLEQLQEQVRQKASSDAAAAVTPDADLHSLAVKAVSEHNSSMPLVPGQLLKGSVIHVDRRTVWLDVGLAKHAKFFRSQVQLSSVVETTSPIERTGPNDIHVGDVLHVILETTETPFGDPAVSIDMPTGPERYDAVLEELKHAYDNQQPVMGRILNSLNGGYAIGIAGLVGFCPFRMCTLQTASRVGVLQPFLVHRFRREPFNMILEDTHAHEKAAQAFKPPPKPWTMTPAPRPNLARNLTGATSTASSVEQSELQATEKPVP
ncbi:hypothetical protein ABBQ38_001567 [Trebouxia sp. C0009 RCD-2024]